MPPKGKPWFDEDEADRVVSFFAKILKHTEGRWAGIPFTLTDWQRDEIIRPLFGWKRWDPQWGQWVRKYSKALILLPRGNGKSELAAGLELFFLCADGEEGSEVYSGAEDRDQAGIIYRVAAQMVNLSPILKNRLKVIDSRKRIVDPKTNSFLQVLPRDRLGSGSQGFKPHGYVIDEVHVQKTGDFMDTMKRGMGKRTQPMGVLISTETDDPTGPAAQEFDYALKVLDGEIEDPSYFVFVRQAPKEAEEDPFNEEHWHAANPALGDFLSIETLRQEATEAKNKPSELNKFIQYRLNRRVKQSIKWISIDRWDASAGIVLEDQLAGRECIAALHLASSTDVVAWMLVFSEEEGFSLLPRFFAPEARLPDLEHRTAGQIGDWIRRGYLRLTPGDTIDYGAIRGQVDKDAQRFTVNEAVYHRWGMAQLSNELQDAGLNVVPISTGMVSLSSATKEFERMVYAEQLRHGGNPVLRWMVGNVTAKQDAEGNIRIDPQQSSDNVSGPIAVVMALSRAMVQEPKAKARMRMPA